MPMFGGDSSPAMLAVFTICPRQAGSAFAAASIIGVKSRTPCTTPQRLTPSTHFQSATEFSPHQPAGRHTSVVEHQVRRAEAFGHRFCKRLHRAGIRHVDAPRQHLCAEAFGFVTRAIERVLLHIDQHQVHAAPRADARAFQAEARARAGEYGGLAGKVIDHDNGF